MANNYFQPINNHFDLNNVDIEDVDDETFLNNSYTNSPLSSGSYRGGYTARSTNPFEDHQQTYAEKRREIEERTLESSHRSLGLLYETEEVGKATAVELAKQREQLEKTSAQLDEINTSLRFSQRHLNGLKSVFGGLKNYLAGNRDTSSQSPRPTFSPSSSQKSDDQAGYMSPSSMAPAIKSPTRAMSPEERYDNHPMSRIRDDSSSFYQREQIQKERRTNPFEDQLEANLGEMCDNLSRLKFLATDLGTEIESQNELLENMNYKIEDVDLKMTKQNKDMYKMLGKK